MAGKRWYLGAALLFGSLLGPMTANAQFRAIERLVMPGPLAAAHEPYEDECASCHVQFDRRRQRDLCLACHEDIALDLATSSGFHSRSPDVGDTECAQCHSDHGGRDQDIVGLDVDAFDHDLTDFALLGSHVDVNCDDCHGPEQTFHAASTECVSCHRDDDQHRGNLGTACADCHESTTWSEASFHHEANTGYALDGAHALAHCASCHVDEQYEATPNECISCHRNDDEHMGNNGTECQTCHNAQAWTELLFDHFATSGFALIGGHADLDCESCHTGNKFEQSLSSECVDCHRDDDAHAGVNGSECADCHKVNDWHDVTFDHARDAGFELHDAHADLACESCHIEPVAVSRPETTCFGCHADDDPHSQQLGEDCGSCHGEADFTTDVRFDHDLTAFPLLGRHDEAQCEDCHESHAFLDAPEQCIDCHADDDAHGDRLTSDCSRCHTPNDWTLWVFDHNVETQFVLDGAHAGLDCLACHRQPIGDGEINLATTCGSCHRADDPHDGEFGPDCAQCHTTESFGALRAMP
jgi:hypothetical protein